MVVKTQQQVGAGSRDTGDIFFLISATQGNRTKEQKRKKKSGNQTKPKQKQGSRAKRA
jgi:hypothetical protein